MTTKEQLINSLIKDNNYHSYLEIGTQRGDCYRAIQIKSRTGVDPAPVAWVENLHVCKSDDFFERNEYNYDIIFVDGLHECDQVLADIVNSAAVLEPNGTIICHDMMPESQRAQTVPRISNTWMGDCWKVNYLLLKADYDITLKFHNFDCGLLEIQLGRNGLDELLCSFSDNLEKLKDINYEEHFAEYCNLCVAYKL